MDTQGLEANPARCEGWGRASAEAAREPCVGSDRGEEAQEGGYAFHDGPRPGQPHCSAAVGRGSADSGDRKAASARC